jgi:hypothetical protein
VLLARFRAVSTTSFVQRLEAIVIGFLKALCELDRGPWRPLVGGSRLVNRAVVALWEGVL